MVVIIVIVLTNINIFFQIDLNQTDLKCNDDNSYSDYHDYYNDYYHYDNNSQTALTVSENEILLSSSTWKNSSLELVWKVDDKAIPYNCEAVFIYEQLIHATVGHQQVLTEKIDTHCSSDTSKNPHQVTVLVPATNLLPGKIYRYCLLLLERGSGDDEAFLPGCSEPLKLSRPGQNVSTITDLPNINSLTAGGDDNSLIVYTRVETTSSVPCTYSVIVISERTIIQTKQLNCSEARYEFQSLNYGKQYTACASPVNEASSRDLKNLEHILLESKNVSSLLATKFSSCTSPVLLEDTRSNRWTSGPWLTLLFTLPGLAFIVTLYVLGRRVWKGGGVPWRWDPRAHKSAKYFLYTGETTTTPSTSLDPLPAEISENTTRV